MNTRQFCVEKKKVFASLKFKWILENNCLVENPGEECTYFTTMPFPTTTHGTHQWEMKLFPNSEMEEEGEAAAEAVQEVESDPEMHIDEGVEDVIPAKSDEEVRPGDRDYVGMSFYPIDVDNPVTASGYLAIVKADESLHKHKFEQEFQNGNIFYLNRFIKRTDLFDPQKGFMKDGALTIIFKVDYSFGDLDVQIKQ